LQDVSHVIQDVASVAGCITRHPGCTARHPGELQLQDAFYPYFNGWVSTWHQCQECAGINVQDISHLPHPGEASSVGRAFCRIHFLMAGCLPGTSARNVQAYTSRTSRTYHIQVSVICRTRFQMVGVWLMLAPGTYPSLVACRPQCMPPKGYPCLCSLPSYLSRPAWPKTLGSYSSVWPHVIAVSHAPSHARLLAVPDLPSPSNALRWLGKDQGKLAHALALSSLPAV